MLPTEYFTDAELSCRCGCGAMPRQASVDRLYALRIAYGKPIRISSGARCQTHNTTIGGAQESYHIAGQAFDIRVPNADEGRVISLAMQLGFTGVGIWGDGRVHIDDGHPAPGSVWKY